MYHKITYAWFERWDFLFLDMIFLQLAYIFSYWVRNGLNNPYANKIYLDIALAICFINLCAALFWTVTEIYSGEDTFWNLLPCSSMWRR